MIDNLPNNPYWETAQDNSDSIGQYLLLDLKLLNSRARFTQADINLMHLKHSDIADYFIEIISI